MCSSIHQQEMGPGRDYQSPRSPSPTSFRIHQELCPARACVPLSLPPTSSWGQHPPHTHTHMSWGQNQCPVTQSTCSAGPGKCTTGGNWEVQTNPCLLRLCVQYHTTRGGSDASMHSSMPAHMLSQEMLGPGVQWSADPSFAPCTNVLSNVWSQSRDGPARCPSSMKAKMPSISVGPAISSPLADHIFLSHCCRVVPSQSRSDAHVSATAGSPI